MALANALAIMLYLSCSAILIRRFLNKDPALDSTLIPANILAILALIFHASDIGFTVKANGGWELGLFSSLSIAAWLMACVALFYSRSNLTIQPGLIIYPIVMISLVLKASFPGHITPHSVDPALEWHILLSLASYSLFTLAAIQALLLALQEKQLRQHNITGVLRKLPPLESMEKGLFQLLSTGFILLTIGLLTGVLFIEDLFAQHLVHKTILSIIAWCVFATLLWGRFYYGWRSITAVRWTLVGFVFLVLAYFGSQFVLEFILAPTT
jgi:ABC-type uncharacterized transport system permease subunit